MVCLRNRWWNALERWVRIDEEKMGTQLGKGWVEKGLDR